MLDRLLAWHEHLIALDRAGTPLGLARAGDTPRTTLDAYAARIGLTIGRGVALPEAIADDDHLPADYRAAALMVLDGQDEAALELLSGRAATTANVRAAIHRALIMPGILLLLALLGGITLTTYLAPSLSAIYTQIEQSPDWATRLFLAAATKEVAAIVVAVLLVAAVAWRWGTKRWLRSYRDAEPRSGNRKSGRAALARRLTCLIRHGFATRDALRIARESSTHDAPATPSSSWMPPEALHPEPTAPEPETPADSIPPVAKPGDAAPDDATPHAVAATQPELPPLIDWALTRSSDPAAQAADLQFASEVYRRAADQRVDRWRRCAPAVIGGMLGGIVVLAYGLAVFVPVIRLLETLSRP